MIYRWEKGTTYGEKYPAHTYIVGSNRHHADDETGWEWTNSNRNEIKKVPGSRVRYNATVSVTKTWLAKYSKIFTWFQVICMKTLFKNFLPFVSYWAFAGILLLLPALVFHLSAIQQPKLTNPFWTFLVLFPVWFSLFAIF